MRRNPACPSKNLSSRRKHVNDIERMRRRQVESHLLHTDLTQKRNDEATRKITCRKSASVSIVGKDVRCTHSITLITTDYLAFTLAGFLWWLATALKVRVGVFWICKSPSTEWAKKMHVPTLYRRRYRPVQSYVRWSVGEYRRFGRW